MLPILLRRLYRGRVFLRNISKNRFYENNNNNLQSFCLSTNIMPPKRKAASAKTGPVEVDLGGAGDQPEPPASKTRKVKGKDAGDVEKKTTRKQVPAKGKDKEKEVPEKEVPEKKKSTRGKKAAETEEEKPADEKPVEDTKFEKVTKRKANKDDTNGVAKERSTRKKKSDPPAEEPKARGRKKADKEEKAEKPGPSNSTVTDWDKINFACTKKNKQGQKANLKISCWNIGGLKSWIKKDCLKYLEYEDPDVFCVQETKCNEQKLPEEIKDLQGYEQYWCASDKEGYAGVGLFTKKKPIAVTFGINVPELDEDGRCITAEFKDYYVVCVYVPNAGRKLVTLPKRLEWNDAFKDYIKSLDDKKPVIICGDMNVSHSEIDLARPANNTKNAGFTQEERDGMTDFLQDGYIDTFRKLYPDKTDQYTFWTYIANARSKNIGWRLDYFIVSERIMDKICDNVIRSEVLGSDHCPLTLFLNI